ncbi:MAG: 4-alpha-glucanotransferase [Clostridia bacterium]|nr:4-alpha-glucanotransferase [Clostridia bacterium]
MARRSGVLLNISSLPSPYGIGVLGKEAREFVDKISSMGFGIWQILPTTPIGCGNSPYASPSAFAGNVLYIDPDALVAEGLITPEERGYACYQGSPYTVDYDAVTAAKDNLLRAAYGRATAELLAKVEAFGESHPYVSCYALFAALKDATGGKPYWEWGDYADYGYALSKREGIKDEYGYRLFCQYLFFTQWAALKTYANSKGVKIFGDMPIYVSDDSAELWARPELFQLDPKTGRPERVAGVPPDYFSEDGQLWGNPLYNWKAMKEDGYSWWADRIRAGTELYDILRIDHFRAMASYWSVPATAETAKEGKWVKGPGMPLFKALDGKYEGEIIAEDLGVFGEDVVKLLEGTGFPGMRVLQFGFTPDEESEHLPHNYVRNTVAYTGTHDNNTLLGWLWAASEEEREFALDYCGAAREGWQQGGTYAPACRKLIEAVWRSVADTVIVPLQDMCGYGSDTRMNIPGMPEGNWAFRATKDTLAAVDEAYFARLNRIFGRYSTANTEGEAPTDEE